MASKSGKLFSEIARAAGNVNPLIVEAKHKDVVHDLRSMEPLFPVYIPPVGYSYEKVNVDGVPTEIFKKKKYPTDKLILVLHGGAYVSRMMFYYRWLNKRYCDACGGTVIHFEYRCAPEDTWPAPLEDTMKVWNWILAQGWKPENIITVGDSAGGHLNIALQMKLHELGMAQPRAAVCMSPWLDMTASGPSYMENYKVDPVFGIRGETPEESAVNDLLMKSELYMWLGDHDRKDPYISPVFADIDSTFPELFVTVGGDEMLMSDSVTIVEKYKAAGVNAELLVGEGMFHAYPVYELFPEANYALHRITDFIHSKFFG